MMKNPHIQIPDSEGYAVERLGSEGRQRGFSVTSSTVQNHRTWPQGETMSVDASRRRQNARAVVSDFQSLLGTCSLWLSVSDGDGTDDKNKFILSEPSPDYTRL